MTSPLETLSGPGKSLRAEPPDAKEFEGLNRSGLIRLVDAEKESNSLASRFDLAYNAAHALVKDLIVACRAVAVALERALLPG